MTSVFLVLLMGFLLIYSKESAELAQNGILLWATSILPSLLPFMILSDLFIQLNIPQTVFKNKSLYCIVVGFLCGFPMGAKTTVSLYNRREITKTEANYLLSFCNQLGPSYICGFLLPIIGAQNISIYLLGIYGIPLLYGILIYPLYSHKTSPKILSQNKPVIISFSSAFTKSIQNAMASALQLGGFIVIFQVFLLVPMKLFPDYYIYLAPFLEVGSGCNLLGNSLPLCTLCAVAFGGFCGYMQVASILSQTDLSANFYFLHKIIQTLLTFVYFTFLIN